MLGNSEITKRLSYRKLSYRRLSSEILFYRRSSYRRLSYKACRRCGCEAILGWEYPPYICICGCESPISFHEQVIQPVNFWIAFASQITELEFPSRIPMYCK